MSNLEVGVSILFILQIVTFVWIGFLHNILADVKHIIKDLVYYREEFKSHRYSMNEAVSLLGLKRESATPSRWIKSSEAPDAKA